MTTEQIILNADVYANNIDKGRGIHHYILIRAAYIEGAYSRNKEVEQWKESKRKLRLRLMQQIHDLRNPWISVEERLPDEEGDYLVQVDSFSRATFGFYSVRNKKFLHLPPNVNVTHWMSIPKIIERR